MITPAAVRGGYGARLWILSHADRPWQMLTMTIFVGACRADLISKATVKK